VAAERQPRYRRAARAELIDAATRYELEAEGLGAAFIKAIDDALAIVIASPERWPLAPRVSPRHRAHRYLLKRFPFSLIYRLVGEEELEVLAVAHQKRRPATGPNGSHELHDEGVPDRSSLRHGCCWLPDQGTPTGGCHPW
jgi:toxin ParE1/3/4